MRWPRGWLGFVLDVVAVALLVAVAAGLVRVLVSGPF